MTEVYKKQRMAKLNEAFRAYQVKDLQTLFALFLSEFSGQNLGDVQLGFLTKNEEEKIQQKVDELP